MIDNKYFFSTPFIFIILFTSFCGVEFNNKNILVYYDKNISFAEEKGYTLTIKKIGNGFVSNKENLIDCGSHCEVVLEKNTKIKLLAIPSLNKNQQGIMWEGDNNCNHFLNECLINMTSDKHITVIFSCKSPLLDCDGDGVLNTYDVDMDNNGLIEIDSIESLNNMRFDLTGESLYNKKKVSLTSNNTNPKTENNTINKDKNGNYMPMTKFNFTKNSKGCPVQVGCIGYELTRNLDFNDDNSYNNPEALFNPNTFELDENGITTIKKAMTEGEGWLPIGHFGNDSKQGTLDDQPFKANFDGKGYTISNLRIENQAAYLNGLFGYVVKSKMYYDSISGCTNICNLYLLNVNIRSTQLPSKNQYYGALVGYINFGSITNVGVTGKIRFEINNDSNLSVGGISGSIKNTFVSNVYTLLEIENIGVKRNIIKPNHTFVGLLIGTVEIDSRIYNSYAKGSIDSGNMAYSGGLIGELKASVIDSVYSMVDIIADKKSFVGGLVSIASSNSWIKKSYSFGNLSINDTKENIKLGGVVASIIGTPNLDNNYWYSKSTYTVNNNIIEDENKVCVSGNLILANNKCSSFINSNIFEESTKLSFAFLYDPFSKINKLAKYDMSGKYNSSILLDYQE